MTIQGTTYSREKYFFFNKIALFRVDSLLFTVSLILLLMLLGLSHGKSQVFNSKLQLKVHVNQDRVLIMTKKQKFKSP